MNKTELNSVVNNSRGRFVGLTLQTSKRSERVSAKIVGSSENYLTLATFSNGKRSDRRVSKKSVVGVG